jgi:hypothetical protein
VFIDDIRLYAARCLVSRLKSIEDLNNDCIVDYMDVNALANDWLTITDQMIATKAPSATGLQGHWKFDDGSGVFAVDSSGNNYNGTIWGTTPKWVDGQLDGALELNGTTDFVESFFTLASSNTVTMTAWIKRKGDQPDWTGLIFHRRGTGGSTVACGIGFSGAGRTNQLQYHWNYNNAATYNFGSDLTVPDKEWAFVALVIEPTKATLYLNGLSATNSITHQKQSLNDINLGRDAAGTYFRGVIDDVRIYNRALPEAEIAYLADVTPSDGKLHIPVQSVAELYSAEPQGLQRVNLRDFTMLAQRWLEQLLWP